MNIKIQNNIMHVRCGTEQELNAVSEFIKQHNLSCIKIHDISHECCKNCDKLGEKTSNNNYKCKVDDSVITMLDWWCGLYNEKEV